MKPLFSHLLSSEYSCHSCLKHNWPKQVTRLYLIAPHLLFTSYFSHKPTRWAIIYGSTTQSNWGTFVKRGNWLEKQNGQMNVGSTLCVSCFLCVYQWNLISTEQKPVGFCLGTYKHSCWLCLQKHISLVDMLHYRFNQIQNNYTCIK